VSDGKADVTIIMPTFNSARYVKLAIESVLAQSLCDYDFIIADDGSSDETVSIVRQYCDGRIRLYENEANLGIYGNLNRLMSLSKNDLIKICCADDVFEPNCLERQVWFMKHHPELAFSRCLEVGDVRPGVDDGLPEVIYPRASPLAFYTFGCIPGNLSNVIFRKLMIEAAGGFCKDKDLPYAGDFETWVRVARLYPFGIQKECLTQIRSHPGRATVVLAKSGAVIPQINYVVNALYHHLNAEQHLSFKLRFLLKYHGSVNYAVQQIHWVVRALFQKDWRAVRPLMNSTRSFAFPLVVCFCLYLLTLNRRIGSEFSYRILLKHLSNEAACWPEPAAS
jgi:glycosyltransferase involved in cell wall biosynthesis